MKLRFVYLMAILFVAIISCNSVEERLISGVVTQKSDDMPLPGVDISVKGSSTKVQTDFDGLYELKARKGDILVFSYIKMETKELKVTSKDTIDVQLEQLMKE